MIEDDVLREVRAAREAYARLHNFDLRAMIADLRAGNLTGDWQVVRRPPRRPNQITGEINGSGVESALKNGIET